LAKCIRGALLYYPFRLLAQFTQGGQGNVSGRGATSLTSREQQYFEKRAQGFYDSFQGYRKSDALLNLTYFNGIRYDPILAERKLHFRATNVFVLSLSNC